MDSSLCSSAARGGSRWAGKLISHASGGGEPGRDRSLLRRLCSCYVPKLCRSVARAPSHPEPLRSTPFARRRAIGPEPRPIPPDPLHLSEERRACPLASPRPPDRAPAPRLRPRWHLSETHKKRSAARPTWPCPRDRTPARLQRRHRHLSEERKMHPPPGPIPPRPPTGILPKRRKSGPRGPSRSSRLLCRATGAPPAPRGGADQPFRLRPVSSGSSSVGSSHRLWMCVAATAAWPIATTTWSRPRAASPMA